MHNGQANLEIIYVGCQPNHLNRLQAALRLPRPTIGIAQDMGAQTRTLPLPRQGLWQRLSGPERGMMSRKGHDAALPLRTPPSGEEN